MKKYLSVIFQIVIGIFSINLFWVIAYIINDPYGDFIFTNFEEFLLELPWYIDVIIPFFISALIIFFGFIGKRYNFKIMFWIQFFSTIIPIIGYCVMRICSDDSNILSLILLPVMLILQPFGIMCIGMLDNITMTLNDNTLFSFNENFWVFLIVLSLVVALFLYNFSKSRDK